MTINATGFFDEEEDYDKEIDDIEVPPKAAAQPTKAEPQKQPETSTKSVEESK